MARKKAKTKLIKGIPYYYQVVEGSRNADGTRQRKYIYGKTVKELEVKIKAYNTALDNGIIDTKETFQGLFKTWLFDNHFHEKKPSTKVKYDGIYRNYILNSSLGKSKINKIDSLVIQDYYNKLSKEGKTPSQIKNLHKIIRPFLLFIYNNGYVNKDYGSKGLIKLPKAPIEHEKDNLNVFTIEEQKSFIQALEGNKERLLYITDLYTGLRIGELLNLTWNNVNLKEGTIKVDKTVKRIKNLDTGKHEYMIQEPKTKKSKRVVPIPKILIDEFKQHKKKQLENKLLLGELYNDNRLVFCTDTGTYLDAANINKRFKKILTNAKIKHRKFHSLRHTYATRLFENDVPVKTVSELLGHSDINTTLNTYTHVLENEKKKVIEQLDNIFIL